MYKFFEIKKTEGNGETTFTLPKSWESAHKKGKESVPRYFYLKSGDLEFPQAYYIANPNKTDEKEKQNKNRIKALMLKVAKNLTKDEATEKNNAVILGEEVKGSSVVKGTCVCKEYDLIWGNKVSCDFRKKVVAICKDLWGESKPPLLTKNRTTIIDFQLVICFSTLYRARNICFL